MKPLEKLWERQRDLKGTVDELPKYYAALTGTWIEEIDFQGRTEVNGKEESNRFVMNYIYSRFLQIEDFGPTVASKLMHMALPDLFVMWDDGVIQRYCIPKEKNLPGFRKGKMSYVAFLILMQENICHAIESHPGASGVEKRAIVQDIQAAHNGLPLPRLLDMANFAVRDCEQTICLPCMKRAKARWAELGFVLDSDRTRYREKAEQQMDGKNLRSASSPTVGQTAPTDLPTVNLPKGSYFKGTISDERNEDKEKWRRRSIGIPYARSRGYPEVRHTITVIDTDGGKYESVFTKSRKPGKVCLGKPGNLKGWYTKHYRYEEVVEDDVYFEYTGSGYEFYIYTSNEWYRRKGHEAQQQS